MFPDGCFRHQRRRIRLCSHRWCASGCTGCWTTRAVNGYASMISATRMSSTRQKNILHKQKYQTTNGFDGMGFPHLYNLYRFSENQLMYEVSLQFYYFCTNILSTCAINLLCKLRAGDGSFAYFKHVIANEGFSLFLMYYLSSGRTATDYRDSL